MEQNYALDWLDQMVCDLNPEKTQPEYPDFQQAQMIVSKASDEQKRLILFFGRIVFYERRKRDIRRSVNRYFQTITHLINNADSQLRLVPASDVNFRSALESVVTCLNEIYAFMLNRYRFYLDPDIFLKAISINNYVKDLHEFDNCRLFKNNPVLTRLLIEEFDSVFYDHQHHVKNLRWIDYWQTVSSFVIKYQDVNEDDRAFDILEAMLIERNFNSPYFVKYLSSKFLNKLENTDSQSQKLHELEFLQKAFNQIPVIKGIIFNQHYEDLSLTVNNWFIHEIEYQSKHVNSMEVGRKEAHQKLTEYSRKNPDKILCNLTVDQLALFFKAADLSKIIVARSLSAIFEAVTPYLSTPNREDISHGSLRVKSYSVEERDKRKLLDFMERLVVQIREL